MVPLLFLAARTTRRRTAQPARVPQKVHCPSCGRSEGFLLDLDGASYRVLEDETDIELLQEAALTELPTPVTCLACRRIYTAEAALAFARHEAAEEELAAEDVVPRPRHGAYQGHTARIHRVGPAAVRHTLDGRRLPVCPQCGAMHGFFADIGGAAYRVLEDDADTDLLLEAKDLLCPRCSAVFEFNG